LKDAYGGALSTSYFSGYVALPLDGRQDLVYFFFGGITAHNHQHMNLLSEGVK
jgi:hypothetical protein